MINKTSKATQLFIISVLSLFALNCAENKNTKVTSRDSLHVSQGNSGKSAISSKDISPKPTLETKNNNRIDHSDSLNPIVKDRRVREDTIFVNDRALAVRRVRSPEGRLIKMPVYENQDTLYQYYKDNVEYITIKNNNKYLFSDTISYKSYYGQFSTQNEKYMFMTSMLESDPNRLVIKIIFCVPETDECEIIYDKVSI